MKRYATLFLMVVFASVAKGQLGWQEVNGSMIEDNTDGDCCAGNIFSLCASGDHLIALTLGGDPFWSTDPATNWSLSNDAAGNVLQTYFGDDFSDGYRSTDNGVTWKKCSYIILLPKITGIAQSGNYLVASSGVGILRSSDSGATWDDTSLSWKPLIDVAANGDTVFAIDGSNLYRSSDNGAHWDTLHQSYKNHLKVIDGTFYTFGEYGLARSTDNGISWTGLDGESISALVKGEANLIASTPYGVIYSSDNGTTWKHSSLDSLNLGDNCPLAVFKGQVYVATDYGMYVSSDDGITWAGVPIGITNPHQEQLSSGNGCLIVNAGQDFMLERSTDDGKTWTPIEPKANLATNGVECLIENQLWQMGLWNQGLIRSSDSGAHWQEVTCDTGIGLSTPIRVGSTLVAGSSGLYRGDGTFRSTDDGLTWLHAANVGLNHKRVESLYDHQGHLFLGQDSDIFRSTDLGETWTRLPRITTRTPIAFASLGTVLFVMTNYGSLYRSDDDGNQWILLDTNLYGPAQAICAVGSTLFVGTNVDNGIFFSTDSGKTWSSCGPGPTQTGYDSFTVLDGYLFAGGRENGVWRRPLSDFGISSVSPQAQLSTPSITAYPNPAANSTTIHFTSPEEAGYASITIVNALGVEVARVFSGEVSEGEHSVSWNVPAGLSPGMYECIVRMNGQVERTGIVVE